MKKFLKIFTSVLLIFCAALSLFPEIFNKINIPVTNFLLISTIFVFGSVIYLYVNIKLSTEDLPWALMVVYSTSFILSCQKISSQNNYSFLLILFYSIFLALCGTILCWLLCLIFERLKKSR